MGRVAAFSRIARGTVVVAVVAGFATTVSAGAAGVATGSMPCSAFARPANYRSLSRALACAARATRRQEPADPACLRRATAPIAARALRPNAVCADDGASVAASVDRCAAAIRAALPASGTCAARKLTAARTFVGATARHPGDTRGKTELCRAFTRAGTCPGACGAVATALTACWTSPVPDPPATPPGNGLPPTPPAGGLPVPAPDEQVVLFGTYEGEAVSTTTVAGQDETTTTARVVVAPGSTPLYVVLSSYDAMIWRFEGDTARIGHVVLSGFYGQGVTGIDAARVADVSGRNVFARFYDTSSRAPADSLARALGRPVDVFAADYGTGTLSLPAATVEHFDVDFFAPVPAGLDHWIYSLALMFNPGGLVDVDPATVMSATPAAAYEVLPQEMGLAQLVSAGALEYRDEYYYIARAIPRFPAGLTGAHAVSFVLGTGVPLPAGDPGHSCVIAEGTGLPVANGFLCNIVSPGPPAACALPAAPAGDQVVLFGSYEGDAVSTAAVSGQDEETTTARVVIEPGSTPLYVVLSSYTSTVFRFEGAVERVERVVLVGYRAHGVTGIPAASVTDLTHDVALVTDVPCFRPFYDVRSPEGVAARGVVQRALGRVDAVAGSYDIGTVTLPAGTVAPSPSADVAPPGFDPAVYRMGLRFSPGGVVNIDPATVVPHAEAYEVVPHRMGLAQLVATGALERRGNDEVFPTFYIAAPIPRFPAELTGSVAVIFILGRDVPMPAGSPGHSCVLSEETGAPLANAELCDLFHSF